MPISGHMASGGVSPPPGPANTFKLTAIVTIIKIVAMRFFMCQETACCAAQLSCPFAYANGASLLVEKKRQCRFFVMLQLLCILNIAR